MQLRILVKVGHIEKPSYWQKKFSISATGRKLDFILKVCARNSCLAIYISIYVEFYRFFFQVRNMSQISQQYVSVMGLVICRNWVSISSDQFEIKMLYYGLYICISYIIEYVYRICIYLFMYVLSYITHIYACSLIEISLLKYYYF